MFSTGMKSESNSPIIQTEPPISTAASSSSAPPSPKWTDLRQDLTANILQRLHPEEILMSAQLVCTTWWRLFKNPAMWRVIDLDIRRFYTTCLSWITCRCDFDEVSSSSDSEFYTTTYYSICSCILGKFEKICRRTVDRSQGQLVELKLAGINVHRSLDYVAQPHRSSQLRRLTLLEYLRCLGEPGSTALIVKLTQLEELHLFMKPWVDPEDFETIGIACPNFKSFTYHNCCTRDPQFIEYTAAIGKSMPNLHHLRLCQHMTGNKVLQPILDGCPNLKSLDLRRCSGFDDRGKRCSDQIKDLWLQSDSYQF